MVLVMAPLSPRMLTCGIELEATFQVGAVLT